MKLGDLCEVVRGSSPRPKGDPRFYGGSVPRLMVADVTRDGKYVTPKIDSLTPEGAAQSRPMKKGDLVIAVSGNPGLPAILETDACIHDGFVGLRNLDTLNVSVDYLYCYLSFFKEQINNKAVGAIFKNLTTHQIADIDVPLPPIAEQRRIAAILDRADAVRRKRQEAIRLTEELLRSAFLEMFGDPVTNPKKWKTDLLSNHITHANNGLSRRRKTIENEGEIVLRLQDIKAGHIDFSDPNRIALEAVEKERYLLVPDDLVFIRVNGNREYVGRCSVFRGFRENVYHNDHIIRIQTSLDISTEYLAFVFNHPSGKSLLQKQIKTSAGQYTISQKGIESIALPLPPRHLQDDFIRKCASINQAHKRGQSLLNESQQLFNSLLQRAFRGEL